MKNRFKSAATIVLIVALCATVFASCGSLARILTSGAKPKDFSAAGMTITLTEEFSESNVVSQTAVYQSQKVIVTVLKEEKSLFAQAGVSSDMSLRDYAQMVITANALDEEVYETDGLVCFDYDKEANGKELNYFASVYKGADAYWLVQFCAEEDDYDDMLDEFKKWAKSVKFE